MFFLFGGRHAESQNNDTKNVFLEIVLFLLQMRRNLPEELKKSLQMDDHLNSKLIFINQFVFYAQITSFSTVV